MRTLLLAVLLAPGLPAQEPELPPPFAWEQDLETAMARSEETGKPVLAYFTFDTCHWCKVLQRETFPDPKVAELGARFHWVYVDRDRRKELPKRYNVSAYPGMLVLGHEGENVYRFHGYKKVPEFLDHLEEGLRRWQLYRDGAEFWFPPPRPNRLTEIVDYATFPAPSQAVPSGMALVGDRLFVAQGDALYERTPDGFEPRNDVQLPPMTQDLASDGDHLFVVTSGWTQGEPILEIDPADGKVLRRIVTEANKGRKGSSARGLCCDRGLLYVLEIQGRIHEVHPRNGTVRRVVETGLTWTFGLTRDEEGLLVGSREGLHFVDRQNGEVRETLATAYRLRAVGKDREGFLVMEQPEFGHDAKHRRVVVHPQEAMVYRLAQKPARADSPEHVIIVIEHAKPAKDEANPEVEWLVGNKRCFSSEELAQALARALKRGAKRALLEPEEGTSYRDVSKTVDTLVAAGFTSIDFRKNPGDK